MDNSQFPTAESAWNALKWYTQEYYAPMAAMYTGDPRELKRTAKPRTFWNRAKDGTNIHVPIAADIASTSADLLFPQPPRCTVFHGSEDAAEDSQQSRLNEMLDKNRFASKLNEGAETASAMGDVYYKLRWVQGEAETPIIDIVQPDCALPEYRAGRLACIHFFTPLMIDYEHDKWVRIYEIYEPGKITARVYIGTCENLGTPVGDEEMERMGIATIATLAVEDMLAVHIANLRPNRRFRESMRGRSDLDGLRGMCDALDETYSSWIRDVRLAKARTIVPAEYLRRKPSQMLDGLSACGSWEFDADVETYVAMDIDPERHPEITLQQYEIRASQHADTCRNLIESIVMHAGYSPQSFGLDINGTAQSGTALTIRERRSLITRGRKLTYWTDAIESLLTAAVRLDAELFPGAGMHKEDMVKVEFGDAIGTDMQAVSSAVEALYRARSASLETRVAMLHPDWDASQRQEEVDRVRAEFGEELPDPLNADAMLGDLESEEDVQEEPQVQQEEETAQDGEQV